MSPGFENVEQFAKWLGTNKVTRAEVFQATGAKSINDIADYGSACATIQAQIIDKRGR